VSEQKICPACGTEYPLSERFCPRDGTALRGPNAQGDLIGTIVAERYHILKKLGEGGMGTVYLAEHVKMGRKAALKVMNPGISAEADAVARFNREAANASRLNHPNVCAIYDFGETSAGLIYLAMEFIEGESLTSVIAKNGFLSAPRTASIIHQAADALAVAHDHGIVHRDLKPDNIMIAKDRDGGDVVKVVDFGIAKASSSDAQKVTKTGLVVGTPEYMSPEQLSGQTLDGRSDIYSLGLVAFDCLTGLLPFPSDSAQETMMMRLTEQPRTLAEMKPDVAWPPELQTVMDKALARDRDSRYQKSAEFGREITKAVASMPAVVAAAAGTMAMGSSAAAEVPKTHISAQGGATTKISAPPPPRTAGPGGSAARKSPLTMGVAAAVLIAGVGGAIVLMKNGHSAPTPSGGTGPVATPKTGNQSTPAFGGKTGGQPAAPPTSVAKSANDSGARLIAKKGAPHGAASPAVTAPAGADSLTAAVNYWDDKINNGTPTKADAEHAIDALSPLIKKLSGPDRSNAIYIRMLAYGIAGLDDELCAAVKEVIAGDPINDHVSTAQAAANARQCK
jgi:eukaryotic-like serine/threonine-protein kinase